MKKMGYNRGLKVGTNSQFRGRVGDAKPGTPREQVLWSKAYSSSRSVGRPTVSGDRSPARERQLESYCKWPWTTGSGVEGAVEVYCVKE